jgi:hypothetical protein
MVGAGLLFLQALISGDEGGPVTSALQEARNGHGHDSLSLGLTSSPLYVVLLRPISVVA